MEGKTFKIGIFPTESSKCYLVLSFNDATGFTQKTRKG